MVQGTAQSLSERSRYLQVIKLELVISWTNSFQVGFHYCVTVVWPLTVWTHHYMTWPLRNCLVGWKLCPPTLVFNTGLGYIEWKSSRPLLDPTNLRSYWFLETLEIVQKPQEYAVTRRGRVVILGPGCMSLSAIAMDTWRKFQMCDWAIFKGWLNFNMYWYLLHGLHSVCVTQRVNHGKGPSS